MPYIIYGGEVRDKKRNGVENPGENTEKNTFCPGKRRLPEYFSLKTAHPSR
jgi:hypothetical protein